MTATPQEVEARYQQNLATYQTPEQVRASHILFKTEGKDEAAVQEARGDRPRQGQGRRGFRRAGQAVLGGRLQGQRRRSRLLRPRHDGEGVRRGRLRPERRTSQRPREVAVRVPHHQDDRQARRGDAHARGRQAAARRSDQVREGAGGRLEARRRRSRRTSTTRPISIGSPPPGRSPWATRGCSRAKNRWRAWASRPTVAAEAFRLEQGKVSGMLQTNQGFAWIAAGRDQAVGPADARRGARQGVGRRRAPQGRRAWRRPRRRRWRRRPRRTSRPRQRPRASK